jgi:predicted nucleotidyltransferase
MCPPHFVVYLFGSRTDDNKRGGDIDLLLIVEDEKKVPLIEESRHFIQVAFKKYLDDQKLDLTIIGRKEFDSKIISDPFFRSISGSLVKLFGR